jgi:hypothetical protein
VNANAVDIDEARVFRMKNDVATLLPVGITRPQQQFGCNCHRCSACDPVSFLHRNLAADFRK